MRAWAIIVCSRHAIDPPPPLPCHRLVCACRPRRLRRRRYAHVHALRHRDEARRGPLRHPRRPRERARAGRGRMATGPGLRGPRRAHAVGLRGPLRNPQRHQVVHRDARPAARARRHACARLPALALHPGHPQWRRHHHRRHGRQPERPRRLLAVAGVPHRVRRRPAADFHRAGARGLRFRCRRSSPRAFGTTTRTPTPCCSG